MGSFGSRLLRGKGRGIVDMREARGMHEEGGSGTPAMMILLRVQFVFFANYIYYM